MAAIGDMAVAANLGVGGKDDDGMDNIAKRNAFNNNVGQDGAALLRR